MRNALNAIEFKDNEQKDIFAIVSSVLHIGNIDFLEKDGVIRIKNIDVVDTISKVRNCYHTIIVLVKHLSILFQLINCKTAELQKSLTNRTIEARGDVVVTPLSMEMSLYARDALAKAIYDRLFSWLVINLNKSLQSGETRNNNVMGILDIYGFEVFEKNSFEQLCINFCNEKLQQLFIDLTLKSEQEEYLKEGIEWQNVEYFDNKIICDLIEEKHKGIIALMDEECLRPGEPSDDTLIAKMTNNFKNHKHYISHQKADIQLQKTMGRDVSSLKFFIYLTIIALTPLLLLPSTRWRLHIRVI